MFFNRIKKPSVSLSACMILRGLISALSELNLRIAALACGSILSNAFGSLIASGILGGIEGILGHAAWRWYIIFLPHSKVRVQNWTGFQVRWNIVLWNRYHREMVHSP